ncbi:hypothetical protein [Blastococcus sp. Marseille-P5729]|uniref:hypothetical protein n=1 Tax=Blastococcus sp. Marseille-P5729 TaxID=2086582 RepID=UPI000D10BECC|nr:hypothetical protein [Blastococcus sp. Marseille-P5729]
METTQQITASSQPRDVPTALRNAATRTAIDGVTTLFSPIGGRTRATLSFRVGTADEPLHQRGISHLVGHLASAAADQDAAVCPVTVSASTLSLHFVGNALAVANEIGAVCHWITSTSSGGRIDERALTRARELADADQRLHAPEHAYVLRHRFGPRGWAAGSYPEHALGQLDADDVVAWVREYLTTQNAVLAISGTKATTLRVPLPAGEYRPAPEVPPSVLTTPALVTTPAPQLSLSGIISTDPNRLDRDRAAAGLTTEIARSRVAYALGRRYGRDVTVRGGPMALGRDAVHGVVWAPVDAVREAKIADIAAEALQVLAEGRLVEGELAAHVKRRLAMYEKAAARHAGAHELLHRQALGALNETPWSLALERRMLTAVDAELVSGQIDDLVASTVLAMRETDPPVRRWSRSPQQPAFEPGGAAFRSRPAYGLSSRTSRPHRLLVDEQGLTLRSTDRPDQQQRWDALALVQSWNDGRVLLTGNDGTTFDVRPEQWLAPDLVETAVRERLPEELSVVEMGDRHTPPAAPLRVTDTVAPAWWWAMAGAGVLLAITALTPIWPVSLPWLRWLVLAVGTLLVVVGGAWAADTWLSERRLGRPGVTVSNEPASEPEQLTSSAR